MITGVLNVNYCYYNNLRLFEEIIDYYEPFKDDPHFHFTVIDDGSQINPLSRDNVPSWWTLYRVEEDYGWGNEMCKNLLMSLTKYMWNALLDMEYIIDLLTLRCYTKVTNLTYSNLYNRPYQWTFKHDKRVDSHNKKLMIFSHSKSFDTGPTQTLNSFIVSKYAFDRYTFGYDRAYAWLYGTDYTLFDQLIKVNIQSRLLRISDYGSWGPQRYEADPSSNNVYRFEAVEQQVLEYIDKKVIKKALDRYCWVSEEIHRQYEKPLPPYIEL